LGALKTTLVQGIKCYGYVVFLFFLGFDLM
jgi:hypothetical protein